MSGRSDLGRGDQETEVRARGASGASSTPASEAAITTEVATALVMGLPRWSRGAAGESALGDIGFDMGIYDIYSLWRRDMADGNLVNRFCSPFQRSCARCAQAQSQAAGDPTFPFLPAGARALNCHTVANGRVLAYSRYYTRGNFHRRL